MSATPGFRCGVIEGFYGRPWSPAQRGRLLGWMSGWGLNTYLYAPKDDLKHRTLWREAYTEEELSALSVLVVGCRERGVEFVYAIAPGLDLRYAEELPVIERRLAQVRDLGVRTFAILFDDIPEALRPEDAARFGTFAGAQVYVVNALKAGFRAQGDGDRLWFCPTVYCGRFAHDRVADNAYLREIGAGLAPGIEVLWTGPQIISEEIPVASIRELRAVIRRRPLIWDNLHANDYDLRRLYLGPLVGRTPELRAEVAGLLSNPNCEFEANFVPLHTLASYARGSDGWTPEGALAAACDAWLPAFSSRSERPFTREDLDLLVALFFLPHRAGPCVEQWITDFAFLVAHPVAEWGDRLARFERVSDAIAQLFLKITELADRELCFTFYRLAWEAQWELTPMRGYVRWLQSNPARGARYTPRADHRPGIYRSGVVARLHRLMPMAEDGGFGEPAR